MGTEATLSNQRRLDPIEAVLKVGVGAKQDGKLDPPGAADVEAQRAVKLSGLDPRLVVAQLPVHADFDVHVGPGSAVVIQPEGRHELVVFLPQVEGQRALAVHADPAVEFPPADAQRPAADVAVAGAAGRCGPRAVAR